MADLVLCSSHDLLPGNGGAVGPTGVDECHFWRAWVPSFAHACRLQGIRVRIVHRREVVEDWGIRQLDFVGRVNHHRPRLVVDPHLNAWKGEHEGVCGLHHPGSKRGKQACEALISTVARAQGTKALNAIGRATSWSGSELHVITRTEAPAVVLEFGYADAPDDYHAVVASLRSGATQTAFARTVRGLLDGWE